MLNKKNIIIGGLISFVIFSGYIFYQMAYKPWLPTEITLMIDRTGGTNEATLSLNKLDSWVTYEYIVKNPPYSLKARYKMVEDFLKNKPDLYSTKGSHIITYKFSKEGWSVGSSFPYFRYLDRSYNDSPITYREAGMDYVPYLDRLVPYGGESGFQGNEIAKYTIDINMHFAKCAMYTSIYISSFYVYSSVS